MSGPGHDQAQRDQKAEEAQREAQAEIDELLWLMHDKRGRRWMWRRLGELRIYDGSFVPGDFSITAFREGVRSVGLAQLATIMKHCPERFNEMQKEAKQNERRSTSK